MFRFVMKFSVLHGRNCAQIVTKRVRMYSLLFLSLLSRSASNFSIQAASFVPLLAAINLASIELCTVNY